MIDPSSARASGPASEECESHGFDIVRTLRELALIELDQRTRPAALESRRLNLRQQLSGDVLKIHDSLVAEGKLSVAPRFAETCTECAGDVPVCRETIRLARIFVQCPHCRALLYG